MIEEIFAPIKCIVCIMVAMPISMIISSESIDGLYNQTIQFSAPISAKRYLMHFVSSCVIF